MTNDFARAFLNYGIPLALFFDGIRH